MLWIKYEQSKNLILFSWSLKWFFSIFQVSSHKLLTPTPNPPLRQALLTHLLEDFTPYFTGKTNNIR